MPDILIKGKKWLNYGFGYILFSVQMSYLRLLLKSSAQVNAFNTKISLLAKMALFYGFMVVWFSYGFVQITYLR